MNYIFKKDIFSNSHANWSPVAAGPLNEIQDVISLYFGDSKPLETILQVGAFELNSSNFQVQLKEEKFLFKRWPANAVFEKIENQLALVEYLYKNDSPVAPPRKSLDNTWSAKVNSRIWGVFRFIPGEYFSGTQKQVEFTGLAVGRLFQNLMKYPHTNLFPEAPAVLQTQDGDIFRAYSELREHWDKILGSESAQFLRAHFDKISACWEEVQSVPLSNKTQLAHYDLHPHNILMNQEGVSAFLDFDACALMKPEIALGFATLKLMRQSVALTGRKENVIRDTQSFLDFVFKEYSGIASSIDLKSCARMEVLRRIALILRLNLEKSDSAWNHVLPIQVSHLYESDLLFGNKL